MDKGIERIRENAFKELGSLRVLDLYDNRIKTIEAGAFRGLARLPVLDLGDQGVEVIEAGAFQGLDSLTDLGLAGTPSKFSRLARFEGSNVSKCWKSNNITSIEVGTFEGLGRLAF